MVTNVMAPTVLGKIGGRIKGCVLSCLLLSASCAPNAEAFEAADDNESETGVAGVGGLEDKALSVNYQAESYTALSGCAVARNHTGYTGTGFVNYGENGTWIEWNNVNVDAAGEYNLTFRYANGANDRPAAVRVNGAGLGNLTFAPTGGWTTWKATPMVKATLRSGTNTIRVTANTSLGGPNLDSMTVKGGDTGGGSVTDLDFASFSRLNEETPTIFSNVTAKYIVYAESHGRSGHNDIDESQPGFVDAVGATLVDYGGGRDKYMALFQVTSSNVSMHANGGAAYALFINTSKTLTVVEATSVDPSIGARQVPGPRASNEIVIYAEDEGGAGTRDEFYMPRAYKIYGSGDDLVYVFADDRISGQGPAGNGAYMRLSIR